MYWGVLALQLCKTKSGEKMKIHGLWKKNYDATTDSNCNICVEGDDPKYCIEQNYIDQIDRIPKIHEIWLNCLNFNPNMKRASEKYIQKLKDHKFWEHEYRKHGACTGFTAVEYFELAVKLYNQALKKGDLYIKSCKKGKNYLIPVYMNQSSYSIQRGSCRKLKF